MTHFSTFAVLPATLFSTLVRGGGPRRSDCRAEWQVVNPTNTPFRDAQGEVSGLQTCRDGDATCDGDGAADGVCTFRLAVCLNPVDEGAPTCTADAVAAYALARPTPAAGASLDRANARGLVDALVALGGVRGGARRNVVRFMPPLAGSQCSPLVAFRVPTRGRGMRVVQGRARGASGRSDADTLRLRCLPQ